MRKAVASFSRTCTPARSGNSSPFLQLFPALPFRAGAFPQIKKTLSTLRPFLPASAVPSLSGRHFSISMHRILRSKRLPARRFNPTHRTNDFARRSSGEGGRGVSRRGSPLRLLIVYFFLWRGPGLGCDECEGTFDFGSGSALDCAFSWSNELGGLPPSSMP